METIENQAVKSTAYRCFLIDDDQEEFEIFQMALASLPNEVPCSYFRSPKVAVEQRKATAFPPSHIFIDLNMHALYSTDELDILMDTFPLCQLIIYWFVYSPELIQSAAGTRSLGYLEKQVSMENLAKKLEGIFI